MLTYKALNSLRPHYLLKCLSLRPTPCAIPTSQVLIMQVTTLRVVRKSMTRCWATSLWNALPVEGVPGPVLPNIQKAHKKFVFQGGISWYPPPTFVGNLVLFWWLYSITFILSIAASWFLDVLSFYIILLYFVIFGLAILCMLFYFCKPPRVVAATDLKPIL